MLVALVASAGAFLCARVLGAELSGLRFLLLGLALIGVSAALCLRFQPGIEGGARRLGPRTLRAVAAVAGLVALTSTGLLFVKLAEPEGGLPWRTGSVVFFWVMTAPWYGWLAVLLSRPQEGERGRAGLEGAALLAMAALVCFLCCWALYQPDSPGDWDSMRVFFAGATLAAVVASALVAASQAVRRFGFSVLVVLHFGGILTAIMTTDPGPILAKAAWVHFYRPYLEFMYLVNAYRFYSPEPSPATQFWFYIEYDHPEAARWLKVPDMDDEGTPRYPLRLRYQRRLAFTENLSRPDLSVSFETVDKTGNLQRAPFFVRRDNQAPRAVNNVLGAAKLNYRLGRAVPYHPTVLTARQYARPSAETLQLLASCARHVLRLPHPKFPDAQPRSVKIYRVLHYTLSPQEFAAGFDPNFLTFYYPYYQGTYDRDGTLKDPDDPFLYWLLPTIFDTLDPTVQPPEVAQPNTINVYAILHALGGEGRAGDRWKLHYHDNQLQAFP
jgi:hypothetical protein